jgi:hypothetical protein
MPTNHTSNEANQSLSSKSPRVVVANSRVSWWRPSLSLEIFTHAVTELLCTSSPAHLSIILSTSLPSVAWRAPIVAKRSLFSRESGVRARKATIRGT